MRPDHARTAAAFPASAALPAAAHERTFDLLGMTVRLCAENDRLLDAAAAVLDGGAAQAVAAPVGATVVLRGAAEGSVPDVTQVLAHAWSSAGVLTFHGAGCRAVVDIEAQAADATLTAALLADETRLRDVLHALVLSILTRRDRQPLHAAALAAAAGGTGVLLAAASGTGKSSVAGAALHAGMTVLSDDTVFVQQQPSLRVWSMPGPLYLPADSTLAAAAHAVPVRRANGKRKLMLPLPHAGMPLERTALCILDRSERWTRARLTEVDCDVAVSSIMGSLSPGFDMFRESLEPCLRAVAAGGAYRLELTADATAALPHLRALLASVNA
jgi:hypothetical protein